MRWRKPIALADARVVAFLARAEADNDPLALWQLDAVYRMRRGELVGLGWENIDQVAEMIRIETTVVDVKGDHPCPHCSGRHRRVLFDTPKSSAGERLYPLVPAISASLMEHRRRQDHDRELYGAAYVDHGLVFARPDGNPVRPDWVSRRFRQLMKATGGPATETRTPSLRALRSTMVTNLHEAGRALGADERAQRRALP